jgi:hypothetical protein
MVTFFGFCILLFVLSLALVICFLVLFPGSCYLSFGSFPGSCNLLFGVLFGSWVLYFGALL